MKTFFKILTFSLLFNKTQAQEFCFENNGLKTSATVSFEIKGNTVKFGVWEQGNYTPSTSAENYLFYGTKTGNKLKITFTGTVPYTFPTNANEALWTLENGVLKIPMNEKNHNTKKFENSVATFSQCVSVKADDYEANMPNTYPCNCDAYVIDTDKNGLNVREKGDKNAAIVAKIPFNEEGTMVHLKNTNGSGWVTLNKATDIYDKAVLKKEGFVFAQKLGVSVTGFQAGKVDIYESPTVKSKVVHSIISGNDVVVVDCKGKWLKVKHIDMNVTGWLRPEDQCANPVTACN